MRALALVLLLLLASPAAARPPALLWIRDDAAAASVSHVALVVQRDATSVKLLAARRLPGPAKLKLRSPEGGLLCVLRDAGGTPLAIAETFDAALQVHGDEPDPETGTLRSISAPLESTAFAIRLPLLPGAREVAFYERTGDGPGPPPAELLSSLQSKDASLVLLGLVELPSP